jgi:hypothetical protein
VAELVLVEHVLQLAQQRADERGARGEQRGRHGAERTAREDEERRGDERSHLGPEDVPARVEGSG